MSLEELGVLALQDGYVSRRISPVEVLETVIERIDHLDGTIGAFRWVDAERALEQAKQCADELVRGRLRGPLHGVPVGIKELFDVAGAPGDYGSEVLAGRVPDQDAEAVSRLRRAGAIVLGTTRAHEFGWGITTQHAELGSTKNPWDLRRVPGGSSGGSGAALAARLVPLALGSDTGGSIRIPATFCGVAGIKPTYGRVSLRGGIPLAPSLDHGGPMARDVRDLAVALDVLTTAAPASELPALRPLRVLDRGLEHMQLLTCPDLRLVSLAADHAELFDGAVEELGSETKVHEVSLEGADEILDTFATIQQAEAHNVHASMLGTFPEQSNRYGADVRGRIEGAATVTIGEYLDAQRRARTIRDRFAEMLDGETVLVTPTAACGPSTVQDPETVTVDGQDLALRDAVMPYTVPQDLAGLPVSVVPVGLDREGLPVGLQLTAARGREDLVLQAARAVSQRFRDRLPSRPPGLDEASA